MKLGFLFMKNSNYEKIRMSYIYFETLFSKGDFGSPYFADFSRGDHLCKASITP
jgi:hypothetical protein